MAQMSYENYPSILLLRFCLCAMSVFMLDPDMVESCKVLLGLQCICASVHLACRTHYLRC
jgi:hypothetical protein